MQLLYKYYIQVLYIIYYIVLYIIVVLAAARQNIGSHFALLSPTGARSAARYSMVRYSIA